MLNRLDGDLSQVPVNALGDVFRSQPRRQRASLIRPCRGGARRRAGGARTAPEPIQRRCNERLLRVTEGIENVILCCAECESARALETHLMIPPLVLAIADLKSRQPQRHIAIRAL